MEGLLDSDPLFFVSYEIETNGKVIDVVREIEEHDLSKYVYTVYNDASCGAEIVTAPFRYPLGVEEQEALSKLFEIAKKYTSGVFKSAMACSTHVTFSVSPKRAKAVPEAYRRMAILNTINYYMGIVCACAYAIFNDLITRSTKYRQHYKDYSSYMREKELYPAVFIPSYAYHNLPKYHKIEWRIPDAMQLGDFESVIRITNFLYYLTTNYVSQTVREEFVPVNNVFSLMHLSRTVNVIRLGKRMKDTLYRELLELEVGGALKYITTGYGLKVGADVIIECVR
ncbi:hypothetical protein J7J18_01455 [bacterium]|nr:hypothetical protein [bacterium]